MTYTELHTLCQGRQLPIAGKNEDGDPVIIEQGKDSQPFYIVTTSQPNGWCRVRTYYADGSTEESYRR
jgi:hypothetical protein